MTPPCVIGIRYLGTGQASIPEQAMALRGKQPDLSPQEAAAQIRISRDVKEVPCDSSLASLLRRGSQLSLRLFGPHPDRVHTAALHGRRDAVISEAIGVVRGV